MEAFNIKEPPAPMGPPWPRRSAPESRLTVRTLLDVADLQTALALERSAGPAFGGIDEPSSAPLCDFMLALEEKAALGVCRLLPHPPRVFSRRASGPDGAWTPVREARLRSPLFTALRYTGLGVLEVGRLAVGPGCDAAMVSRALWDGILDYMDAKGMGFALGSERSKPAGTGVAESEVAELVHAHGLSPDMENLASVFGRKAENPVLSGKPETSGSPERANATAWLPPGLNEVLRRGGRLVGEPEFYAADGRWDFLWVVSRPTL